MARSRDEMLDINRSGWDRIAKKGHGRTALPRYGPLTQQEDELGLLGEVRGHRVLEIGCGSGHTLAYLAERGASELWGLDISAEQIGAASRLLKGLDVSARLFVSPMEENPGIPEGAMDLVVSIFSMGWAVDLERAVDLVRSYLAPGGRFVFSWEHPVYSALDSATSGAVSFARPYQMEGELPGLSWAGIPIVMHARKMSTILNTVIGAGLEIRRIVEGEFRPESGPVHYSHRWFSPLKARTVPTTLIVDAVKK